MEGGLIGTFLASLLPEVYSVETRGVDLKFGILLADGDKNVKHVLALH